MLPKSNPPPPHPERIVLLAGIQYFMFWIESCPLCNQTFLMVKLLDCLNCPCCNCHINWMVGQFIMFNRMLAHPSFKLRYL